MGNGRSLIYFYYKSEVSPVYKYKQKVLRGEGGPFIPPPPWRTGRFEEPTSQAVRCYE